MNLNLIVFNIAFYLVNFLLYAIARQDASSSLGVGFFAIGFWLFSAVLLVIFVGKRIIVIRTIGDKTGIVTATPLLIYLVIVIARNFG